MYSSSGTSAAVTLARSPSRSLTTPSSCKRYHITTRWCAVGLNRATGRLSCTFGRGVPKLGTCEQAGTLRATAVPWPYS